MGGADGRPSLRQVPKKAILRVTASVLTRRIAAVALGAVALMLPSTLSAQRAQRAPTQSEMPPWNEIVRVSPSGSYLAARHASVQRDASAA